VQFFAVARGDAVEFAVFYFHCQAHGILRLKRWVQRTKLINNTAQAPNITFFIVLLVMNLFRRHIIWSSDMCKSKLTFLIHHSSKTKISQFHITITVQKNVSRFQVSMEDFLRILTFF
jgi:hypothetical protein